MLLTFIAQNLKFGGLSDDDGRTEDRWPVLVKRFSSSKNKADFLLLTEARDWDKQGHRQLARAMRDLDMDALPLAPSKSGQHVALLYRRETVGRWENWNTGYVQEVTQSFGVGAFDVGLSSNLSVVPVHLDPFRAEKALQEAFLVASRGYRHGPFSVIGGDINYPPARGLEPDFTQMRPYNIASRTVLGDKSDILVSDRRIGLAFEKSGYVDVAYHMYEKTKKKSMLERTASDDRIDQFWVSEPLANAIIDYWVIDNPPEASDHKAIAFQFDTDLVKQNKTWSYH